MPLVLERVDICRLGCERLTPAATGILLIATTLSPMLSKMLKRAFRMFKWAPSNRGTGDAILSKYAPRRFASHTVAAATRSLS